MRILLCIGAAVFALLGTARVGLACSCIEIPDPLKAMEQADFVFSGTVTSINDDPEGEGVFVADFRIEQAWKGFDGEEAVTITQPFDSCTFFFGAPGESYLVYGSQGQLFGLEEPSEALFYQVNACSRTRLLSQASEDLEALGSPRPTIVKASFWGQIKAFFQ